MITVFSFINQNTQQAADNFLSAPDPVTAKTSISVEPAAGGQFQALKNFLDFNHVKPQIDFFLN